MANAASTAARNPLTVAGATSGSHRTLAGMLSQVGGRPMACVEGELVPFVSLARLLGMPGARLWRRVLSEGVARPGAGLELIDQALAEVVGQVERQAALAGV